MTMINRNYYLVLLSILLLVSACTQQVTIKGELTNADKQLVRLAYGSNQNHVFDTVRLNSKGNFNFKYKVKTPEPVFLILSTSHKILATLLVENGENIIYKADLNQPQHYTIEGSEGSKLVKDLQDRLYTTNVSFDSLVQVLVNAETNTSGALFDSITTDLDLKMGSLFTKHKQFLIRFIVTNSKSLASYMAMYQNTPNGFQLFGKEADAIYYRTLRDSLATCYPKSQYVKKLNDDYEQLTKTAALNQIYQNATEVTGMPDINLPDSKGEKQTLHQLRGKCVLLSFWASWDKGSTFDNNELLAIHKKYAANGFEIYQVSLDIDPNKWLETITNQQLPWISVCDFTGKECYASKLYNIQQLPTNFLLDTKGELIGKNLEGAALEQAIKAALTRK